MTTAASNPFEESPVPALPPETTPTAIRDALIDEERAEFEQAYQAAMAEAAETMDLTRVLDVLRNYHRIAWLTQRQGSEAHRRMLDQVRRTLATGEAPANAVSGEEIKALIAKRLGQ
jgi:RNA polymerase-interacting CarD/CdnL/TRCF family regulator